MISVDRWVAGWVVDVDAWVGEIGVKQVGRLSTSMEDREYVRPCAVITGSSINSKVTYGNGESGEMSAR